MMNDYKIRKATTDDLPTIMTLIDASREIMRSNGNLTQWPVGYPAAATVKADIDDGTCYLITDNEKAIGSFALKPGPDPTYSIIYNGEWLDNTQDYYVIHRITSLPEAHGIFDTLINYSFSVCPNIRIDTHEDILRNNTHKQRQRARGISKKGLRFMESQPFCPLPI